MLKEKTKIHRLDVSCANPCFVIEDKCNDTKHVHIHRKTLTDDTEAPISSALNKFICGTKKTVGEACASEFYNPAITYAYDEWHTVSGVMKKVCIGNPVWLHEAGVWVVDVYEETQTPPTITEKPDPQNFYRKMSCESPGMMTKRLCKTYEFIVEGCCDMRVDGEGSGCEGQYVKCTA